MSAKLEIFSDFVRERGKRLRTQDSRSLSSGVLETNFYEVVVFGFAEEFSPVHERIKTLLDPSSVVMAFTQLEEHFGEERSIFDSDFFKARVTTYHKSDQDLQREQDFSLNPLWREPAREMLKHDQLFPEMLQIFLEGKFLGDRDKFNVRNLFFKTFPTDRFPNAKNNGEKLSELRAELTANYKIAKIPGTLHGKVGITFITSHGVEIQLFKTLTLSQALEVTDAAAARNVLSDSENFPTPILLSIKMSIEGLEHVESACQAVESTSSALSSVFQEIPRDVIMLTGQNF